MAPTAHTQCKTTNQWPAQAMSASLRLRNIHESSVLAITALKKPMASIDAPPSTHSCRRSGSSQVGFGSGLLVTLLLLISEIPMCAFREKEKSTAFLAAHVGVWFWFLLFIGSTIFTSKKFRIVVTPLPTIFTSLPANYGGVVTLAIC
jgi:hypothetical protein